MARLLELWGRLVVDVLFPITTGVVIGRLKEMLAGRSEAVASGVSVTRVLPPKGERAVRMVTVRDDGGVSESVQSRRRLLFNVWAESSVRAERLALLCMALVGAMPDGAPITFVDEVNGPFEVLDASKDLLTVDGETLTHYSFTARVSVRGTDL